MAVEALFAVPNLDTVWTDVCTMTVPNTLYPVTNLAKADPQRVVKALGVGSTITFIHSVARKPVGLTIHNHNLAGATVTFAGQSVPIGSPTADGQVTNVWLDLRQVAIPTTTQHQLVIASCPTSIVIGRVSLPTSLAPVRFQVGNNGEVEWDVDWPNSEEQGYYYSDHSYDKGVRIRSVAGQVRRLVDQQLIYAVCEAAKGRNLAFPFIPDSTVNDSWWSKAGSTKLGWVQKTSGRKVMTTQFHIREMSMGLHP
jgi:hypothetical protein